MKHSQIQAEMAKNPATRLDREGIWPQFGGYLEVSKMDSNHLINVLGMIYRKPTTLMSLCLADLEASTFGSIEPVTTRDGIWTPGDYNTETPTVDKKFVSLVNLTSMPIEEFQTWAWQSPCMTSIRTELLNRGINIDNMMDMIKAENMVAQINHITVCDHTGEHDCDHGCESPRDDDDNSGGVPDCDQDCSECVAKHLCKGPESIEAEPNPEVAGEAVDAEGEDWSYPHGPKGPAGPIGGPSADTGPVDVGVE